MNVNEVISNRAIELAGGEMGSKKPIHPNATALFAITGFGALLTRKYKVARIATMLQVSSILWGWGISQSPYLLQVRMTITQGAAAPSVLWALIGATAVCLLVLFPSLWYLLRLFKTGDQRIPLH